MLSLILDSVFPDEHKDQKALVKDSYNNLCRGHLSKI